MNDGFVRVAAAPIWGKAANCARNGRMMALAAETAAQRTVQVLVLPELCVTGATCGDLFFQQQLLADAAATLRAVCEQTKELSLLLVVGCPVVHGGKLYNCAAVLHRGRVLGLVPKMTLSTGARGGSEDARWFAPGFFPAVPLDNENTFLRGVPIGAGQLFCCEEMPGLRLGVTLGDDYPTAQTLADAGAVLLANMSAVPDGAGRANRRRLRAMADSARLHCALLFASAGRGESVTDAVLSGHSLVAEDGVLLAEGPPFTGSMAMSEIDTQRLVFARQNAARPHDCGCGENAACCSAGVACVPFSLPVEQLTLIRTISPTPFVPAEPSERAERCEEILTIQAHALAARKEHVGATRLVLGVSGGLDSAVALLVAARAQQLAGAPAADILAVTLPGFGTTPRTLKNAQELAVSVGATFETVDITATVRSHFADIGHDENTQDVVYENAQARMRTLVLMDMANQRDGFVVGTGDLSELALGWATYGGDHLSMYSVNAGVPKTLLPHLVLHEISRLPQLAPVLQDILDTPVSPELLPAQDGAITQHTEEIVGPYELHDFFLYYMLRWGFSPRKIFRLAQAAFDGKYTGAVILRWMRVFYRRFFAQQFKRSCLPDGPVVGSVCLSPRGALRMPSDAVADGWLAEIDLLEAGAQS